MKWRTLLWKIYNGALPVGAEFAKRNIGSDFLCKMCNSSTEVESLEHLFQDSPVIQRLWFGSDLGINVMSGNHLDLQAWISDWLRLLKGRDKTGFLITSMIWTIWCNRNEVLFRGVSVCFRRMMNGWRFGTKLAYNSVIQVRKGFRSGEDDMMYKIQRFDLITLIGSSNDCSLMPIQIDAGWNSNGVSSAGWLTLNSNMKVLHEEGRRFFALSPLHAELKAVELALHWAISMSYFHVRIQTDCIPVIRHLFDHSSKDHRVSAVVQSISYYVIFIAIRLATFIEHLIGKLMGEIL